MSYLLITSAMPNVSSGSGRRTFGVAAALSRHAPVEVAYVPFGWPRPATEFAQQPNLSLRELPVSRGAERATAFFGALAAGAPLNLARAVSPGMIEAAATAEPTVTVIADGPPVAAALLSLARRRSVLYLAHNLESSFRQERGRRRLKRFERAVLRRFSESWMVTEADAAGARALAGSSIRLRQVPNVIDVSAIAPTDPVPDGPLLFVADFNYAPNREAFGFLCGSVMPEVWRRRPATRVTVVGRGLGETTPDHRIGQLGFVESLDDVYAGAGLAVIPLLHGGGSPLKFIEALAHGLPVVATEHAARLLEAGRAGEHFEAAEGASGMAEKIVSVLEDPDRAARLAAAGRELAQESYSVESLATVLAQAGQ